MSVISFRFTDSANRTEQERLIGRLKRTPGIRAVGRIDEESSDETIARMCFAEAVDRQAEASVVKELRHAPAIDAESVAIEPLRGLIP